MACTIDHLRRDLRVRVLQAFQDKGGIRHGPGRDEQVLRRVWALAAAREFKEAEEQLREPDQSWNRGCAEALTTAVEVHADDEEGAVYEWLREQATDLWYCWGSTATSGGEGAAMMPYIRAATDRFGEIDRHRALHLPGRGGLGEPSKSHGGG